MIKELSIVLSPEGKNHRKIAQEWYGLSDEQMKDMDVHHNPPRSLGGRNIPEHLYVYHHTLHSAVHNSDFTKWARDGGKLGSKAQPRETKVKNGIKHGAKNLQKAKEQNPHHQRNAALRSAKVRSDLMETDPNFRQKFVNNALNTQKIVLEKRQDPEYDLNYRNSRGIGGKECMKRHRDKMVRLSNEKTRKPVVLTHMDTGEIREFESLNEAARQLSLSQGNLSSVLRGLRSHVHRWKAVYSG